MNLNFKNSIVNQEDYATFSLRNKNKKDTERVSLPSSLSLMESKGG